MHRLLSLTFIAIAASLAPSGAAQGNGCEETAPCPLDIDVDDTGFRIVSSSNFTQGDWFYIHVCNLYDDVDHTLTLEGYDLTIEVPAGECRPTDADTSPDGFQFDTAGRFNLTDEPSGDRWEIQVFEGDVVDIEDETETDPGRETDDEVAGDGDNDSPGLGLAFVGVALLCAALYVSRRAK